jgi:hypothetical protein
MAKSKPKTPSKIKINAKRICFILKAQTAFKRLSSSKFLSNFSKFKLSLPYHSAYFKLFRSTNAHKNIKDTPTNTVIMYQRYIGAPVPTAKQAPQKLANPATIKAFFCCAISLTPKKRKPVDEATSDGQKNT